MASTEFVSGTVITKEWLNDTNKITYGLASTAGGQGAELVGFNWALNYAVDTVGWFAVSSSKSRIPALKHIPISLWAGLAAGTETADIGPYVNLAIAEAAVGGGVVMLPAWTLCHSTTITWSAKGVALDGGIPKHGVTASSAVGCCLKWTGVLGGSQVTVTQGGHNAIVEGILFDANDLADTCLAFVTAGGAVPQGLHMPSARNLRFVGYRGPALVFGNPNAAITDTGQMQQARLDHCSWWGGGPTATLANVVGLLLNAQNCEVLYCTSLFFDPYPLALGGTQLDHQNHIKVVTGGLSLHGVTFTRAVGYCVDVIGECGLVMNHVRSEDPLLLRTASGFASNPIHVSNVEGRDGAATGSEIFISIGSGGGSIVKLENIRSTGHVRISAADNHNVVTRNITFTFPGTSTIAILGGTPYAGAMDLESNPGVRSLYNSSAIESWRDSSNVLMYRNDRGRVRVKSLQGAASGADCLNFAGVAVVSAVSATHTVTFAVAEPDTNYRVMATMNSSTGTPAAGSNRIVSVAKTTAGFTVTFEAAAGAGNSVSFAWMIFRA